MRLKNVATVLILVGISLFIRFFVFEIFVVRSEAMFPNLLPNDYVFVNKAQYRISLGPLEIPLGQVQRGDVVLYKKEEQNNAPFLQRIVGIPGDLVLYQGGDLYINEMKLSQKNSSVESLRYDKERFQFPSESDYFRIRVEGGEKTYSVISYEYGEKKAYGPFRLKQGEYFALGDFRPLSRDSRHDGFVRRQDIIGKAIGVAFSCKRPKDKVSLFCPLPMVDWERIFTKIL